jgi:hypothetical protein
MCVVDGDRQISSIVTQSAALKFCHDNVHLFHVLAKSTTVCKLTLGLEKPLTIHDSARPLTAFRIMADNVRSSSSTCSTCAQMLLLVKHTCGTLSSMSTDTLISVPTPTH